MHSSRRFLLKTTMTALGLACSALSLSAAPDPSAVAAVQAILKKRVDGLTLLNEAHIQQYEAVKRKHMEANDLERAAKTDAKIAKLRKEIAELQASQRR